MSRTYFGHAYSRRPCRWQCSASRGEVHGFVLKSAKNIGNIEERKTNINISRESVFGYIYHAGTQNLVVTVPGDVAPVVFSKNTVLSGVRHDEDSPDVFIAETGIYEICYSVLIHTAKDVCASFSLQANGQAIEGSTISRLLNTMESVCSATTLTELSQDDAIRLVMTSCSPVSAEMKNSGVCGSLMIKKVN